MEQKSQNKGQGKQGQCKIDDLARNAAALNSHFIISFVSIRGKARQRVWLPAAVSATRHAARAAHWRVSRAALSKPAVAIRVLPAALALADTEATGVDP